MVRDKSAFVPFSTGEFPPSNLELRTDVSRSIRMRRKAASADGTPQRHRTHCDRVRRQLCSGEDGTALLEESLDTFTIALAPLMLVFKKREV